MNDDRGDGATEKRLHARKPFRLYVKLSSDKVSGQRRARDISLSGIFIEGVDNLLPGQEVWLSLPFSTQERHVKLKGKVVRVTADGIGIHFDILSIDME